MKEINYCCPDCFSDIYLKEFIKFNGSRTGKCSYCNRENQVLIDPIALSPSFEPVIDIYHFNETGKKLYKLLQRDWNIFKISDEDIQAELLKEILGKDIDLRKNYQVDFTPGEKLDEKWEDFRNELKYKNRFFPEFKFFEDLITISDNYLTEIIGKESNSLYRARINKDNNKLKSKDLKSPPKDVVTNGRANPVGISYYYLASNTQTAISEVRPSKGDIVTVAKFDVTRRLKLCDLRNPKERISPFKENDIGIHVLYKNRPKFSLLGEELSKPIVPRVANLEYLPSQYLCERIKNEGFNGIIYRSSLEEGDNYVIFNIDKIRIQKDSLTRYYIEDIKTISTLHDKNQRPASK